LPDRTLRYENATAAAAALFRNWLGYLSDDARAALPAPGSEPSESTIMRPDWSALKARQVGQPGVRETLEHGQLAPRRGNETAAP
jgi:hypothetical protein